MSERRIHKPESFSTSFKDVEVYLHMLLKSLDDMEISLYQSRKIYIALQGVCKKAQKGK